MQRPSPASTEYQHDKDGEGDNSDIASTELPALFKDCSTDEARTAWIVAKLKATSFSEVHELLDITEETERLFTPRQIRVDGELIAAPFKLNTQPRAKSFALLLFTEPLATGTLCQQCASIKSKGPADCCFQPEIKFAKGACTNCFYSGRGNVCSLRRDLEAQQLKEKRKAEGKPPLLTSGICQKASLRELERWANMLRDCLRDTMVEEHKLRQE